METKIGKYKGIEVTVVPVTYTEDEIEKRMNSRLAKPVEIPSGGPVETGCSVQMDFKGMKDGVPFDGGSAKNYVLKIGSHQFIPGFEEQMVGMMKGETRNLELSFPEDYPAKELAGQPVVFEVTVHEITETKMAESLDELARYLGISGVTDEASLRTFTETQLAKEAEDKTRMKIEDAVMDALLSVTECDLPADRVDLLLQEQTARLGRSLRENNLSLDMYLQMTGMSKEVLRAQLEMSAKEQVKFEQALTKIIELEGISVSDDEIAEQMKAIADYNGVSVEEAEKHVSKAAMVRDMANMKASQVILNSAIVHKAN